MGGMINCLNTDKWFNRADLVKKLFNYYYDIKNGYDKEYFRIAILDVCNTNKKYYSRRDADYYRLLYRQKIGLLPTRKEYIAGFKLSNQSKNVYFAGYFYDQYDCIKCKDMILKMLDKEKQLSR